MAQAGKARGGSYVGPSLALVLGAAYCLTFLVSGDGWLPTVMVEKLRVPRGLLWGALRSLIGTEISGAREWIDGGYLAIVGIGGPWLVMALLGRGRPRVIGVRRPNRFGGRMLVVAFACSLPFLWWMVGGSGLADYYLPHLRRAGAFAFLTYYTINMLGEHFLLHGVMLAALRPGLRWPDAAPSPSITNEPTVSATELSLLVRFLRWIGWAQPEANEESFRRAEGSSPGGGQAWNGESALRSRTRLARGWNSVRTWIGLPRGCLLGVIGSALLFALVHVGKDPRELVLSLPGGIALAYLAYRTDSFLTPFFLHLATAGTALGMMLMTGSGT